MKIEKLRKLQHALRTQVPDEQFDMTIWCKQNGLFCGCAMGWAAKLRLFDDVYLPKHYSTYGNEFGFDTTYGNGGHYAIELIFDLNRNQVQSIFYSESYRKNPTPNQVADRIEEVINGQV